MKFTETGNTLLCNFTGRLDGEVCAEIERPLKSRINEFFTKQQHQDNQKAQLVFDLNGVDYISSAFLRLCLIHCKLAGKTSFTVARTSNNVYNVFRISGFTEIMQVDDAGERSHRNVE
ncbi:MAG: STAS domain-containing protein [Planctomycetaceae bacterium]|nr:STAS domain-containing protein [Planctomycetaceae bacterium]